MVHEAVSALIELMPPPDADVERFHGMTPAPLRDSGADRFDWESLAERTGWRYPADYRDFLEAYGAGGLVCGAHHATDHGHTAYFENGCPEKHKLNVVSPPPIGVEYNVDRRAQRWPGDGLRTWGVGSDCLRFYWRCTDPDPDLWTVVVGKRDENDAEETFFPDLGVGMAETILALLGGGLDLSPYLTLPGPPIFEGWRTHELRFREEYPDFRTWQDPLPARWYDT
jgi:hypothetical protein